MIDYIPQILTLLFFVTGVLSNIYNYLIKKTLLKAEFWLNFLSMIGFLAILYWGGFFTRC